MCLWLCSAAVRGRRPFGKAVELDYEEMSDQDWEEEPEGESLSVRHTMKTHRGGGRKRKEAAQGPLPQQLEVQIAGEADLQGCSTLVLTLALSTSLWLWCRSIPSSARRQLKGARDIRFT